MSRPDHGGMPERLNATDGRGDVLSFSREDAARLAELPLEIAAPILHALLKWLLSGEDVPLDDPRDRAMPAGFKEHQLGNAARRGKLLNDQTEKSDKAVQARRNANPRDAHGTPTDNPRDTQVLDKAKAKDKDQEKVPLSLADGTDRGGLTPPVCPSLSVEDAKKTLAVDAPPLTDHVDVMLKSGIFNVDGIRFANGTLEAVVFSVGLKIYTDALDEVGEEVAETLQEVLDGENSDTIEDLNLPKSFYKTPPGGFVESALDAYDIIYLSCEATNEDTCYDKSNDVFKRALLDAAIGSTKANVENRAGFILARLKKVAAAVKVLEAAKSKKPLSDGDY